jgi:mRNA guanylyltransferase
LFSYLVTEKTDGVRALLYIQGADQALKYQQSWLVSHRSSRAHLLTRQVDRKQRYFSLGPSNYPHWRRSDTYLGDTVFDGEIVIELDPNTGRVRRPGLQAYHCPDVREQMTCYYAFDCLVLNGEYVAKFAFVDRYEVSRRNDCSRLMC